MGETRNTISAAEVQDFKEYWCDENQIISEILRRQLSGDLIEPILDVGAGLCDIAVNGFGNKKAVCIDSNPMQDLKGFTSPNHERLQVDFFQYDPAQKIHTIFISHTLQFLDNDIASLNAKVHSINPLKLILVVNRNNDFMGEIIEWCKEHCDQFNPEIKHANFPEGYKLEKNIDFVATLRCDSYHTLAQQVSYLMLFEHDRYGKAMQQFLEQKLPDPSFTINESIEIYHANER